MTRTAHRLHPFRAVLALALALAVTLVPAWAPAQTVEVTSPNGGEEWEAGIPHEITWSTTGTLEPEVFLQFTLNGFIWNTIDPGTPKPNTGSYAWTPPAFQSTTCKVEVRAYLPAGGSIADRSDDDFTLYTAIVNLTSPDGGEAWQAGSSQTVTWTSGGSLGPSVDLAYSIDGGASWVAIAASTPNDGSHPWTVPSVTSSDCRVRITGYPMAGGTTEDVSQDPFEIFDPAIWVHWIVLETDGASRIRKLVLLR